MFWALFGTRKQELLLRGYSWRLQSWGMFRLRNCGVTFWENGGGGGGGGTMHVHRLVCECKRNA